MHRPLVVLALAAMSTGIPTVAAAQGIRNGGFEGRNPERAELPADWAAGGPGYDVSLDSVVVRSGGLSLRMSKVASGTLANAAQSLDADVFRGQRVVLSGYIRTQRVDTGYAGLWLRLDAADGEMLFLDNMADSGPRGTTDWARFEVAGVVDADVDRVVFGALLPGSGTAWFDDLSLESAPPSPPSDTARAYLERAIDLIQESAFRSDSVDWQATRRGAIARAAGAEVPSDTYPAIRFALAALGDGHSFFREPVLPADTVGRLATEEARSFGIRSAALEGSLGYIAVPGFVTGSADVLRGFAEEVQARIRELDRTPRCGWVVDLRRNNGGNMWPMLAGLGPILGEGEAGAFIGVGGRRTAWGYSDGEAWRGGAGVVRVDDPYHLQSPAPPVAVLTGPATASSGEGVVVAFRGRADTRSFGASTAGLSTANRGVALSDGAVMLLTVSVFADRTGQTYGGEIEPDEIVAGTIADLPVDSDPVVLRASQWLLRQRGCQR